MKELSIELRKMAREQGLCDQWFGEWKDDSDNTTLFDKYKRGIDFAISKDYPTLDYIRSHWSKQELMDNNIFVDCKDVICHNLKGTVIVNGDCDLTLNNDFYNVCDVYIRHNSKVKVTARQWCKVMLNVYDNSEVEIECSDDAKVYIYVHTDNCSIHNTGDTGPIIHKGETY